MLQETPRPRSGKVLLVVDDDEDIREALRALLTHAGHFVVLAENGRIALEKLRTIARCDLVLLDLMMPELDGWQFRVAQMQDPALASIPVIALSADRSAKAAAVAVDAYLTKPVDADALFASIERLFLAREREEMRARLVESDRLSCLGTLAAGVAHEINNPLTYVIANLELISRDLRQGRPGARLEESLGHMRDGLERIRTIVQDLRLFSRPVDEETSMVDVRRALDSSANIVGGDIRQRARLVRDYEEVPMIAANEARLGQVFLNLIINATQALPEGRAEDNEIRLATRSGPDGSIVVEVHDTGAGIPPEALGHIFEPFFTTKPFGVGTGLGLSICHGIVAAMGGRLTVTTEVGKGTCFRVELPTASDAPGRHPSASPLPAATRRGRVLIVDDEPRMCATLEELLSDEHEVLALTSARDAQRRIAAGEHFDVIVSDLMMPELSGMDLYAELSRIAPEQAGRMIFLTGGAFTQRARDFVAEVKNTFLDKPFDVTTLRALIRARL